MSYAKKTMFSSAWGVGLGLVNQLCSLIVFVILSRYLSVQEFGLVALCFLVTEMLVSLSNFGINQLLIQRPYWSDRFASSCFKLVIFVSLIFSLLMIFVAAPLAEQFFLEGSFSLLSLLSLVPLISSISNVSVAKLLRKFDNRTVTLVNSVSTISSSILTLVLVYLDFGVISVVFGRLFQSALATCTFQFVSPFIPNYKYRKLHRKKILAFGIPVFGQVFLTFISSRVVNFVSLFMLGSTAFAFVSVAQRAIRLATEVTVTPLNGVLLQSFSRVKHDASLEATYIRVVKIASFIIYPMFVGLSTLSTEVIYILFGDKWLESANLLSILCYTVVVSLPIWFLPTILVARAQTRTVLKLNIIGSCIAILSTAIGAFYSMEGLVYAALLASIITIPIKIKLIEKHVQMRYIKVILSCAPSLIASLMMAISITHLDLAAFFELNVHFELITKVGIGFLLYIVFSFLVFRKNTIDVLNEFKMVIVK
ncbi:oligosaccharide flippase family protein [Alteromonas sp. 4B03]|uniref:oligosaccharide flippase family protein n=2 Tax=unclassified Alteromonas TaxID=2614992 RepID=UPI003D2DA776